MINTVSKRLGFYLFGIQIVVWVWMCVYIKCIMYNYNLNCTHNTGIWHFSCVGQCYKKQIVWKLKQKAFLFRVGLCRHVQNVILGVPRSNHVSFTITFHEFTCHMDKIPVKKLHQYYFKIVHLQYNKGPIKVRSTFTQFDEKQKSNI